MNQNFDEALEAFRAASEQTRLEWYARNGYKFAVPGVEVRAGGRRYAKLFHVEYDPETGEKRLQSSIHAFVDRETGDIFKPAGLKAPAKHARGNIFQNEGRDSLTPQGMIHDLR